MSKQKQTDDAKDIWTLVKEHKAAEDKKEKKKSGEANVVFLGPKGSGKSSLVQSYMYRDAKMKTPKPTTGLDYNYTRNSSGISKDVSHFWELGGGRALVDLLEIPLTPERMLHSLIVLVLDLSKPESVVDDAEFWLKAVRNQINARLKLFKSKKLTQGDKLVALAKQKFGQNHEDASSVDLSPVPMIIIGNKWDLFLAKHNSSPDRLRTMSRTLRALAHHNGAALIYLSNSPSDKNIQTFRLTLARHVTNRPNQPNKQANHTQPIVVLPAGSDTFAAIERPNGVNASSVKGAWIAMARKTFPSDKKQKQDTDLPDLNLNPEPTVDAVLAERNEELQKQEHKAAFSRRLKGSTNA